MCSVLGKQSILTMSFTIQCPTLFDWFQCFQISSTATKEIEKQGGTLKDLTEFENPIIRNTEQLIGRIYELLLKLES